MRSLLIAILVSAWAAPALGDVSPPEQVACEREMKLKGQGCRLDATGATGTCQESTCSNIDYSNRNDAGGWGTRTYACLKCLDANGHVPTSAGGCSFVPATSSFRELGALALAGSFSLLFFLRRRRRS
jgi:hypothetical protein